MQLNSCKDQTRMWSSKQDMSSMQENQRKDRELSSELIESLVIDRELSSELKESPVNPSFLRMSTTFNGESPTFHLQVNGEALWRWRMLSSLNQLFDILQENLSKIGYRLSSPSRARVGAVVKARVDYFTKKVRNTSNNDARRAARAQFWCSIALQPDEIVQEPGDVISELKQKEELLVGEIQRSRIEVEDKASQLYEAMATLRSMQRAESHNGKSIVEVGLRQQRRHLQEIRAKAEKALWFAETYGLVPKSLQMEDKTGAHINVTLAGNSNSGNCNSSYA